MARSRLFLLLYLLSGSAALLYEVVWLRLLTLSMGHTSGAVGTVLAAFMGGLAIGAWCGGRVASSLQPERALRAYAALEITVAVCALLLPLALGAFRPLLAWAYADGTGGALFDAVRLVVSLLVIAIPAAAMGASYPIAVQCMPGFETGIAGLLYAANTIGAAAGAAITGFLLLPALGLFGTTLIGVALNLAAATGALLLRRGPFGSAEREPRPAIADLKGPRRSTEIGSRRSTEIGPRRSTEKMTGQVSPGNIGLAAATLGLSGFVALIYEVTWTRILAMILGPTTYAFSAMLVAFISGLAIGSAIAATTVRRIRHPGVGLGAAMMATAAAALVACAHVDRLPLTIAAAAGQADATFSSVFALQVALAIAIQLPMTIALGATFPLAIALGAAARDEMPAGAATIYAANTAGAIAGALAASFILIPRLGLQASVQLASVVAIVAGLVVAWRSAPARGVRITATVAAAGAIGVALFMPQWNHERMASGAYRFAPSLAAGDIETGLEAGRLSYYREGAAGTVSVKELIGVTSLAIDGKVDASNGGADVLTQKLLAHLPLLLHENPRSVFVIGLGSGVTLGAALRHPIERAVVAEISPEVVAASDTFAKENHRALRDSRTRLIVGDGRSHVLLSPERYDVIISEPSNPWMAGVSTLFTREFFLAARSRLEPGGILCQWAHTYNISDADLRSIVATFLFVFPNGSAWLVGESDLLLIGSRSPVRALDEGITRAWARPGVAENLAEAGVRDPFSVLTLFVARGSDLQQYALSAPVQSDDRLSLEFSAPRAIYGRFQRTNVDRLREVAARARQPPALVQAQAGATAAKWRDRAQMELQADAPELAYQDFLEALETAPDDAEMLAGYVSAAAAAGRLDDAEAYLRGRAARADGVAIQVELSRVLAARGEMKAAAVAAQHAAALDPSNVRALGQLVSVLADDGNEPALEQLAGILTHSAPDRPVTMYCEMRLAHLKGDFAQAASFGERLTSSAADEENAARNLNLLGIAYGRLGNDDRARRAFEASLRIAPRAAAVLVNLGMTELRSGNAPAAAERFSQALFLYPTLAPALEGMAQALDRQGQARRAAAVRSIRGQTRARGDSQP